MTAPAKEKPQPGKLPRCVLAFGMVALVGVLLGPVVATEPAFASLDVPPPGLVVMALDAAAWIRSPVGALATAGAAAVIWWLTTRGLPTGLRTRSCWTLGVGMVAAALLTLFTAYRPLWRMQLQLDEPNATAPR